MVICKSTEVHNSSLYVVTCSDLGLIEEEVDKALCRLIREPCQAVENGLQDTYKGSSNDIQDVVSVEQDTRDGHCCSPSRQDRREPEEQVILEGTEIGFCSVQSNL